MSRASDEVPLRVPGTSNLRDLGGLPVDGGAVAAGRLYRSDALSELDDDGRAAFASLGISRVVDLRDALELERQPTVLGPSGPPIVHVPVYRAADPVAILRAAGGAGADLDGLYTSMLDASGANLAEAVTAVAEAPVGAVLVHCTAGKDRTGVVIALLLDLLGVPADRIVDDYAATEHNLSGAWAERMLLRAGELAAAHGVALSPGLRQILVASPPEAMRGVLRRLRELGGAERYLVDSGLAPDVPARLRQRFVDRA